MTELPDPRGPTYRLPSPPPPDPTGWHELRRRARATLWPPQPAAWAALLALLVAAAGLHGLWFQATLPGRLPSATDWKAAAALLARDALAGDAVALAPPWAEHAREALPERLPGRPDFRLAVMALPSYAADVEDLAGVRRVWLLSLPGAPGGTGPVAAQLAARSSPPERALRIGQLELVRYDLRAPLLPVWTLADRLPVAAVDGSGATITRETREVAFQPRTCVLARWDGTRTGPAVIRLPPAPLGTALRGRAALAGDVTRGESRASVSVRVDGVELARKEATPSSPSWNPFQVDTSRLSPGTHEVSLEISPSGPIPRGVCVELVALP